MIKYLPLIIYPLFILSINYLSEPKRAYRGNILAIFAMILTLLISFLKLDTAYETPVAIALILGALTGIISAHQIKIPNLPQLVALFNGLGGLSAGIIGIAEATGPNHHIILILLIIGIGFITFSGSVAAFLKLSGHSLALDSQTIHSSNFILLLMCIGSTFYAHTGNLEYILGFTLLITLWGFFFILPIGGADMSIVISLLNSFSGWSTVLVGFSLNNPLLIIVGTLIGSSGTILTYIMTKSMNRKLLKVIFSPIAENNELSVAKQKHFNRGTPRDAAFLMQNAQKVIIVPGFGMAAANAQDEVVNLARILKSNYHVSVKFAIHPVAGRMPGHMNVLLAEANADLDDIFELKDINQEFASTDVAYVIGANDITNPLAKTDKNSLIYQMPILEVEQARKILYVKRSLNPGYSQIDNPLFYNEKTIMLLGDAKEVTKQIITDLE